MLCHISHLASYLFSFLLLLSLFLFLYYPDEVDLESVAPKIQQMLRDCSEDDLADMVSQRRREQGRREQGRRQTLTLLLSSYPTATPLISHLVPEPLSSIFQFLLFSFHFFPPSLTPLYCRQYPSHCTVHFPHYHYHYPPSSLYYTHPPSLCPPVQVLEVSLGIANKASLGQNWALAAPMSVPAPTAGDRSTVKTRSRGRAQCQLAKRLISDKLDAHTKLLSALVETVNSSPSPPPSSTLPSHLSLELSLS